MATLTLRNVKGSALTHTELDSNFLALDSDLTNFNTISGVTYPDSAGRAGQLLTTHGDGSTSFDSVQAGAINDVFWENSQTLTANHTILAGRSALSAGPITIASGVTATLDSDSRWVIL